MKTRVKEFDEYLAILGIEFQHPNLETLNEIVYQHIRKFPFENISKLYYRKHLGRMHLPSLEQFLSGNQRFKLGGTCYTVNYYLFQLLSYLGYKVKLCGADMSRTNAHLAITAKINGQDYLVDVGYAAPFYKSIPLDNKHDEEISYGMDRFVISPRDEKNGNKLTLYRRGKIKDGYYLKPAQRHIEDFNLRIIESFNTRSTFLNSLLLAKCMGSSFISVHNFQLIISQKEDYFVEFLPSAEKLVETIEQVFGIPKDITKDALCDLQSFSDAWDGLGCSGDTF